MVKFANPLATKTEGSLPSLEASIQLTTLEHKVQKYWEEDRVFERTTEDRDINNQYIFYDGPPFATGLPHYGHLLAGTVKDVCCRYATMQGYYIQRRFGWDCHGLPVEYEMDKLLGIKSGEDLAAIGTKKYNDNCRVVVDKYCSEWKATIHRFGRWIDFEDCYRTMDFPFMQSVWSVFQLLWEHGAIYRSYRVMPYSVQCRTPLSNFEVSQSYKERTDPSVLVKLALLDSSKLSAPEGSTVYLYIWTTTPWTLPSNVGVCVNPEFTYGLYKYNSSDEYFIILPELISILDKKNNPILKSVTSISTILGKDLSGLEYEPCLDYYERNGAGFSRFKVVCDQFVEASSGTGLVHMAPAHGEDDFRVCKENNIIGDGGLGLTHAVDFDGKYSHEIPDFVSQDALSSNRDIIRKLGDKVVLEKSITHQYPHCWRSDSPLIYLALPSWFLDVAHVRDRLIENNKKTNWVPEAIGEKRFFNWLSSSKDWCFSRSRVWGTPIPIFTNGKDYKCITDLKVLSKFAGREITDLHREFIDDIEIVCEETGSVYKRVEDTFDCWFESGSMPYALHPDLLNDARAHMSLRKMPNVVSPVDGDGRGTLGCVEENTEIVNEWKNTSKHGFPANFIAEGLDQTRGWFYTLLVISTYLMDSAPWKNLICTGLVLAEDGKKMSKRLQNYPDPMTLVEKSSADAIRLYLCSSPVVRGEPLNFSEAGVHAQARDILLPYYHAVRFCTQAWNRVEKGLGKPIEFPRESFASEALALRESLGDNLKAEYILDFWILTQLANLIKFVKSEMKAYRLYNVCPEIIRFLDKLTNIYIRLNRVRIKKDLDPWPVKVLWRVLHDVTLYLAPFAPFLTEVVHDILVPNRESSVHLQDLPENLPEYLTPGVTSTVDSLMKILEFGRSSRELFDLPVRRALKKVTIIPLNESTANAISNFKEIITTELNVLDLELRESDGTYDISVKPNWYVLGKVFGKQTGLVTKLLKDLTNEEASPLTRDEAITIKEFEILPSYVTIEKVFQENIAKPEDSERLAESNSVWFINQTFDWSVFYACIKRDFIKNVQAMRKTAGLIPTDTPDVHVTYKILETFQGKPDLNICQEDKSKNIMGASVEELHDKEAEFHSEKKSEYEELLNIRVKDREGEVLAKSKTSRGWYEMELTMFSSSL